jgi:hypothetical protein
MSGVHAWRIVTANSLRAAVHVDDGRGWLRLANALMLHAVAPKIGLRACSRRSRWRCKSPHRFLHFPRCTQPLPSQLSVRRGESPCVECNDWRNPYLGP